MTAAACNDGTDNDGDGLNNCEDPDCQLFAHCRGEALVSEPLDAAVGDAWWQSEMPSAPAMEEPEEPPSEPSPPMPSPEPAEPPDDPAPPSPSPAPTPGVCDPDATACECAAGDECAPDLASPPPNFRITQIDVEVPKQTSYTLDNSEDCVDSDRECAIPIHLPPFVLCGCTPDPWVIVLVDGEEVGRTDARVNTTTAQWELDLPVALGVGSEIRFEVMDRDLTKDALIYTCPALVDEDVLASGSASCEQSFTTDTGRRPFVVSATLLPIET